MATRKTTTAGRKQATSRRSGDKASATAAHQRDIQSEAMARNQAAKKASASKQAAKKSAGDGKAAAKKDGAAQAKATKPKKQPVQAGARRQPENPMPAQHLRKPGREQDLELQPRYLAPDYRGSGKLEGKVAIVTGGDSGIGRAVAVLFAREGADVAIVYLDEHEDAQVTRQAVENEGTRCIAIAGDVKDSTFCERAVAQTVEAFGHLDVLVNNAAFQQSVQHLEDITDAQLDETLMTNIGGYFHMARAALPHLGEGASIINTGSEVALVGSKHLLDYSATKGAIHAFTLSLASNLLERGIRVNAVAPGPVWTPLNPADRPAKKVAKFGQKSDMGRPAQPEEMSPAYVFLASPVCSSYVNGVILPAMGGPHG